MRRSELFARWLGPLDPTEGAGSRGRALFFGAGFTKAVNPEAPSFQELNDEAKRRLELSLASTPDALPIRRLLEKSSASDLDPSDLFEAMAHHMGRLGVLQSVFAEPQGWAFRLAARPRTLVDVPLPADVPSTFRPLREWLRAARARFTHLGPLDPRGGTLMFGRLIAEGAFDRVLSTNWDAYLELGALLAGVRVFDDHDHEAAMRKNDGAPSRPATTLRVYDRPSAVTLQPRPHRGTVLLKLHGGTRTLCAILTDLADGRLTRDQAEAKLRACFLIASSDLNTWTDGAEWVSHAVRDILTGRSTLFVGTSFADPAVFDAVRERVVGWSRWARRNLAHGVRGRDPKSAIPWDAVGEGPSVFATYFAKQDPDPPPLKLVNAMTVRAPVESDRSPRTDAVRIHAAAADGVHILRLLFCREFLAHLLRALPDPDDADRRRALVTAFETAADACPAPTATSSTARPAPATLDVVQAVCDALAPSARWAAIAEGLPPFAIRRHPRALRSGGSPSPQRFESTLHGPLAAWWYAPWTQAPHAPHGHCATCAHLRLTAHVLAWLLEPQRKVRVAAAGEWFEFPERFGASARDRRVWFWPWPWPWGDGLLSNRLRVALAGPLPAHVAPGGRHPPELTVCPIAHVPATDRRLLGDDPHDSRRRLILGIIPARVLFLDELGAVTSDGESPDLPGPVRVDTECRWNTEG